MAVVVLERTEFGGGQVGDGTKSYAQWYPVLSFSVDLAICVVEDDSDLALWLI